MKQTTKFISFLTIAAILLFGCQLFGTATPSASQSNAPGITPTVEPNTYVNQENGVQVVYPPGWYTEAPAQGDQALTGFVSPDQSVSSYLYVFPAEANETPESAIASLSSSVLTGLTDVPVMEVSAVLAAHAGPGAAGIAVLGLD